MAKSRKRKVKLNLAPRGNTAGILISSFITVFIQVLLTVLVSLLLLKSETISESFIMYFYFCSVLPGFIGAFISSKLCSYKGIVCGLLISTVYAFILTVILLFLCGGKIRPDIGILYLVIFIFGCLGGIFGANTKRLK